MKDVSLLAGVTLVLSALITEQEAASFPSNRNFIIGTSCRPPNNRVCNKLPMLACLVEGVVDERKIYPLLSMLAAAGGNESQQPG